jgi:hypothetical protein
MVECWVFLQVEARFFGFVNKCVLDGYIAPSVAGTWWNVDTGMAD